MIARVMDCIEPSESLLLSWSEMSTAENLITRFQLIISTNENNFRVFAKIHFNQKPLETFKFLYQIEAIAKESIE